MRLKLISKIPPKYQKYNLNKVVEFINCKEQNEIESIGSTSQGIYPQGSDRPLTDEDLAGLSKWQLKIMRNEIFARHGYIFKTAEMIQYFKTQNWYEGIYSDVNDQLSQIEKNNLELIKRWEKK